MFGALIPIAASLLGGLFSGKHAKKAATQASAGGRFQDVMPYIIPLLKQQQQHNDENYAAQQAKYSGQIDPLQQQIASLAMRLMPRNRPPMM